MKSQIENKEQTSFLSSSSKGLWSTNKSEYKPENSVLGYYASKFNSDNKAVITNRILCRILNIGQENNNISFSIKNQDSFYVDLIKKKEIRENKKIKIDKLLTELAWQSDFSLSLLIRYLRSLKQSNNFFVEELIEHFKEGSLLSGKVSNEVIGTPDIISLFGLNKQIGNYVCNKNIYFVPNFSTETKRLIAQVLFENYLMV